MAARLPVPAPHPRASVSGYCSTSWSLTDDVAFWKDARITNVGVPIAKLADLGWDAGVATVRDSGVRVSNVIGPGRFRLDDPSTWDGEQARLTRAVLAAAALAAAVAPVRAAAEAAGVAVALEHTNSLRPDVGFVHTLRDAVDLAADVGLGVCIELNACWLERGLAATIRRAVPIACLVQVSDFVVGTTSTPARVVPGDGDLPLERLIRTVLDAGYGGDFDLELIGPRIEAEGYPSAIRRATAWLSDVLGRDKN